MKIAQSNVVMESARSYSKMDLEKTEGAFPSFGELTEKLLSKKEDAFERSGSEESGMYTYSKQGNTVNTAASNISDNTVCTGEGDDISFQYDLLYLLLRRLIYGRVFGGFSMGGAFAPGYDTMTTQSLVTKEEYESTEFHAKGEAITEDGRKIDFKLDIKMSRSYMEYMDVKVPLANNALIDPLVINVGSGVTEISDKTFSFDLDADGKKEEISQLGSGSGFLALDKNGDGEINDGSELFGTKSGDGFADLARYDLDGNGWIDENDDVFTKLKVWCKSGDGEDILMDLKEADIGAVYLGNASSEFTLNDMTGRRNGIIRSTGFFLKESLGLGTIQHVDMAAV